MIPAMSEPIWTRAVAAPERGRRPEIASLRLGSGNLPDLDTLFTFMRDAELRFRSLRMRIEERTTFAGAERVALIDVAVRHPGLARVTASREGGGSPEYDTWTSNGERVATYSGTSKVSTERPVRRPPRGLRDSALPARSRIYEPLTPLPADSLPETFVHPAGFCQNVLSTGRVWVSRTVRVCDREGIAVECDHPRSVLVVADRPDHHLQVVADTETGILLRLVETIAGEPTRSAEVTELRLDAPLPDSLFALTPPPGSRRIY